MKLRNHWWKELSEGDVIEALYSHTRFLVTRSPDEKGTLTCRKLAKRAGYWQAGEDALIPIRDAAAYRRVTLDAIIRTDGGAP